MQLRFEIAHVPQRHRLRDRKRNSVFERDTEETQKRHRKDREETERSDGIKTDRHQSKINEVAERVKKAKLQ